MDSKRHLYVIPEDDADRQVAVGFRNHFKVESSPIKVMPVAGGWLKVLETFQDEYIKTLRKWPLAHVVMLIDFDGDPAKRRARFEEAVPDDLRARVFVVGSKHDPETLKQELNKGFEDIGTALADDCSTDTTAFWDHEQLKHNEPDRQRLVRTVRPFLFS